MSSKLFFYFFIFLLCFSFPSINTVAPIPPGVFFPEKDGVLYLTDETYEEAAMYYEYLLIAAVSESCNICLYTVKPMLKEVAAFLQTEAEPELKGRIAIGTIVGKYNFVFLERYDLMGYPRIILTKNNEYLGQLTDRYELKDFILFLRRLILRPVQLINDRKHYDMYKSNSRYEKYITYYGEDASDLKDFSETAKEFKGRLTFINIQNPELIKEVNATQGQISFDKNMDEKFLIEYPINHDKGEKWSKEKILNFINKYNHEVLIDFNDHKGQRLLREREDNLLLIIKKNSTEEEQRFRGDEFNRYDKYERLGSIDREGQSCKKVFYEMAKEVRDIIQSSYIVYDVDLLKKKEQKKEKRGRFYFDEENDRSIFGMQRKAMKEAIKRQEIFTSKLKLNKAKKCEIRLLNIDKSLEDPLFYFIDYNPENTQAVVDLVRKWKEGKLTENDAKVGEIDPDYLIFEEQKNSPF